MRTFLVVLIVSGMPATALGAQGLAVYGEAGVAASLNGQFRRVVVLPMDRGFGTVTYTGRHGAGPVLAARVAWHSTSWGIEAAGGVRFSDRKIAGIGSGAGIPTLPPSEATVASASLRIVWRAPIQRLELGAGPLLLRFGGEAYRTDGLTTNLARRSLWGASVAARMPLYTSGRVTVALTAEDGIYRVRLVEVPPGADTTRTPLQHDLALSLGTAVRLR